MKYVTGNVVEANERYIAQGCNALGVMGKGVAKAIKQKYKKAYNDYKSHILKTDDPLGTANISEQYDGKIILNLITQRDYGNDAREYASLEAIKNSIIHALSQIKDEITDIAIPKIGAGLGGLKWSDVEQQLIDLEKQLKINFTVYELEKGA